MNASTAFSTIGALGLAGAQSPYYSSAGISQKGTVTAQQTTNFVAKVYDITKNYKPDEVGKPGPLRSAPLASAAVAGSDLHGIEGTLVQEIPLPDPAH